MARLVISEKPSVAKAIAAVLGAKSKKDGYYSNFNRKRLKLRSAIRTIALR